MTRVSTIEPRLREQYGELEVAIPGLVNVFGQEAAASRLGVSQAWLSRWLKENGYVLIMRYVKHIESQKEGQS